MNILERRQRIRIGRLANRVGCRIERPKPEDAVDLGAYRLVDLKANTVLLGSQFDASLEAIETYLKRARNPTKTPTELHENIVRQLAAQRGYLVRKSRPRLYDTSAGAFQLLHKSDPRRRWSSRAPTIRPWLRWKRFYGRKPCGLDQSVSAAVNLHNPKEEPCKQLNSPPNMTRSGHMP